MPLLGKKVYRVTPGRAGIRYKKEEQSQAQPAAGAKEAKQENGANADSAEAPAPKGQSAEVTAAGPPAAPPAGKTEGAKKENAKPKERPPIKEVFVMRITGEVFESYEDYLETLRSYLARKWTCRYTGTSGLTMEEALNSEAKSGLYTAEMPETHVKPALEIVQHSLLGTDQLVKKIVSTFTGQLVPGEAVKVGEKDYVVVGKAEACADDPKSSQNKFKLLEQGTEDSYLDSLARELIKRARHPLNKSMVRKWLYDVAETKMVYENKHVEVRGSRKKNAWFVLADVAQAHQISTSLPENLSFTPAMSKKSRMKKEAAAQREKRKLEKEQENAENAKRLKKLKDQRATNPNVPTLKKGSMKFAAYEVLKHAGAAGLSVNDIMDRAQKAGLRDFSKVNAAYNKLFGCLCSAPQLFTKVDRGVFSCRVPTGINGDEGPIIIEGPKTPDEKDHAFPGQQKAGETSMVRVAKAAVQKMEDRVAKSEQNLNDIKAIVEIQLKERPKKIEVPSHLFWNPDLEAFMGDSYDRKAVVGHKKWVETEKQRLAHEQECYIKAHKQQHNRLKLQNKAQLLKANGELQAAKDQLKKAYKVLLKAESISLVKSGDYSAIQLTNDKDLQRELERERQAVEKKRKLEEEKEQRRVKREKEMEERRRMKEVANLERRFPLEDKLLVQEIAKLRETNLPIELPKALPEAKDAIDATFVQLASIAACLSTFGKMLGMTPTKFETLAEMVKLPGPALAALYRDLLSVLLLDGSQHPSGLRRIRRWVYTMTSEWGCVAWPDVLARYILTKPHVQPKVREAAALLQEREYQRIPYEAHVDLLQFLLDDIVETRMVHEEIDRWQEEREDFQSQKRENRIELNRKRRERLEAEKDKRRKEEEERKRKREEAERIREEAIAKGQDVADMDVDPADSEDDSEDEYARYQIPEDKVAYRGDPMDRKGVLAHKKWLENERVRLQRALEQHLREKAKKQREEQIKLKAVEKAIEQEDSQFHRLQDALDKELSKRPIREAPLGLDRDRRTYYWNVAGLKQAIYVQSPENGDWKSFSDEKTFLDLAEALDHRGLRERTLKENVERKSASIRYNFAKALGGHENDATSKPKQEPTRSSSRLASLPTAENGHGKVKRVSSWSSLSEDSDVLDCVEDSLEFLGHEMESIAITADKCGIPYLERQGAKDGEGDGEGAEVVKPGTWKEWLKRMKASLADEGALTLKALELLLVDMEESIWTAFPNAEDFAPNGASAPAKQERGYAEMMENSSSDEEIDERSLEGFAKMKRRMRSKLLWFSNQERAAWVALVESSKTVSQVGYCAAVLEQRLTIVQRTMKKKGKKVLALNE